MKKYASYIVRFLTLQLSFLPLVIVIAGVIAAVVYFIFAIDCSEFECLGALFFGFLAGIAAVPVSYIALNIIYVYRHRDVLSKEERRIFLITPIATTITLILLCIVLVFVGQINKNANDRKEQEISERLTQEAEESVEELEADITLCPTDNYFIEFSQKFEVLTSGRYKFYLNFFSSGDSDDGYYTHVPWKEDFVIMLDNNSLPVKYEYSHESRPSFTLFEDLAVGEHQIKVMGNPEVQWPAILGASFHIYKLLDSISYPALEKEFSREIGVEDLLCQGDGEDKQSLDVVLEFFDINYFVEDKEITYYSLDDDEITIHVLEDSQKSSDFTVDLLDWDEISGYRGYRLVESWYDDEGFEDGQLFIRLNKCLLVQHENKGAEGQVYTIRIVEAEPEESLRYGHPTSDLCIFSNE